MTEAQPKVALFAGATGLVGAVLLDILVEAGDFSRVVAVTRRPLAREHPRLANRTVQFDKIASQLTGVTCHTAFCCLGTTLRAAGSEAAFRRVDVD
jgi:aspartate-semialdehyde dehydrogenase